jgi:predicted nucleic acid-binding Zn ribbon protein
MEAILKQISQRENPKETINSRGYMPRVHEVRSPCQWLEHCDHGKCPAFVRLNGNFYCAKMRAPT